jgi:hypothetical protein
MAALRLEMFKTSTVNEDEICKLLTDHLLSPRAIIQWRPAMGDKIPTPNTNEIVVSKAFFQRGFRLPSCDFFRSLHHVKIKLVHLNLNSILQIAVFIHPCEVYLAIPPNFDLFKYYFFLKYQPSAANCQVIDGVGLQARAN